ncbi:hypothetical protein ABIB06_006403 [Bradyrhizobium sp. LB8.2]
MTSMLVMLFSNPGGSGINSGAASLQAHAADHHAWCSLVAVS